MTPVALRKVWITGARGQLGTELVAAAPPGVSCIATDRAGVDIGDRPRVLAFAAENRPDLIINAAAYTAVDKAESEPDLAFRINRDGAAHLAEAASQCGARILQVSTDYVFDGRRATPYRPDDAPNPLSIYGESKLAGEWAVRKIAGDSALIVRTAWVHGTHGGNFVKTMLRLLRERREVRVVCDQVGTPSHARGVAGILWRFFERAELHGVYHWTDSGVASWYDVAVAVRRAAQSAGMEDLARVDPIATADYPTPAARPAYSVLDKAATWRTLGFGTHWQSGVESTVNDSIQGAQ